MKLMKEKYCILGLIFMGLLLSVGIYYIEFNKTNPVSMVAMVLIMFSMYWIGIFMRDWVEN